MYYFFKTVPPFVSLFNANRFALIIEAPCVSSEVGTELLLRCTWIYYFSSLILKSFFGKFSSCVCELYGKQSIGARNLQPTLDSVIYYSRIVCYLCAGCLYVVSEWDEYFAPWETPSDQYLHFLVSSLMLMCGSFHIDPKTQKVFSRALLAPRTKRSTTSTCAPRFIAKGRSTRLIPAHLG